MLVDNDSVIGAFFPRDMYSTSATKMQNADSGAEGVLRTPSLSPLLYLLWALFICILSFLVLVGRSSCDLSP